MWDTLLIKGVESEEPKWADALLLQAGNHLGACAHIKYICKDAGQGTMPKVPLWKHPVETPIVVASYHMYVWVYALEKGMTTGSLLYCRTR